MLIGYDNVLDRLDSEDKIIEILEDASGYFDYNNYEEELINDYNFTKTQLNVMKAILMNEFPLYKKLVSYLGTDKFVYCVCVDDDYLCRNKDLYFIINNSKSIETFSS